jgi:hypothetical protein
LLSNGLVNHGEDEQDEWSSGPEAAAAPIRLPPPPATREAALAQIGAVKKAVYALVRQGIDDFERAAPWDLLYYPPDDADALLAMVGGLVVTIKGVPKKIDSLLRKLPAGEAGPGGHAGEPTREDVGFLLQGIHRMVAHDIKRLEGVLAPVRDRGAIAPPTLDEGQRLCELSADLKGKYASALMGAAASLIGEGQWDGVELEPVLFPEKAEEFRFTRELTTSLGDAVLAIRQLPEQVRFTEIVERWRQESRVDQYALADLATLRGHIGHLLKEGSRRALYTGDYHQISRREVLLSQRINEIERLHQATWAPETTEDLGPAYARLVQLTLEMAAVLDANILKSLIGEKTVNGLRGRAAAPKGPPKGLPPRPDDDGLDSLVPLLAEDDLRIFFEMLLTAVQRRASLGVREAAPPAAAPVPSPPPPPPPLPAFVAASPAFSAGELLSPLPEFTMEAPPAPPPAAVDPRAAVARIRARLDELQAPTSSHWNNFRLAQRMLEKHARLPGAMFHSINPFLQEIAAHLVPDLKTIAPYKGLTREAVLRLETVCRELCDTDPSPAEMVSDVPRKLERIVRFLDALRSVVSSAGG